MMRKIFQKAGRGTREKEHPEGRKLKQPALRRENRGSQQYQEVSKRLERLKKRKSRPEASSLSLVPKKDY